MYKSGRKSKWRKKKKGKRRGRGRSLSHGISFSSKHVALTAQSIVGKFAGVENGGKPKQIKEREKAGFG